MEPFTSLKSLLLEKSLTFESVYKDYLNENLLKLELTDELQSAFIKSSNSMRFWAKKVSKHQNLNMVFFTTFLMGPNGNVAFNDIFLELKQIMDLNKIKCLQFPENRRYLGIEFHSKEDADFMKQNFVQVRNNFIIYTNWLAESKVYKGRIHWLPINVSSDMVDAFLSKYFIVKELKRTKVLLCDDFYAETTIVEFGGLLKSEVDLEKIPHISMIQDNKILITVKGRRPICINCMTIGHIRSECDFVYCSSCKSNCRKSHQCFSEGGQVTMAEIAKSKSYDQDSANKKTEIKNNNEIEGEQNENGWLQVKRNNSKSYSRKKASFVGVSAPLAMINPTDISTVEMDLNNDQIEAAMECEQKGNFSPSDTKLILQSKRKKESDSSNEDDADDTKFTNIKDNSKQIANVVTENVYDILNTDSSEY